METPGIAGRFRIRPCDDAALLIRDGTAVRKIAGIRTPTRKLPFLLLYFLAAAQEIQRN